MFYMRVHQVPRCYMKSWCGTEHQEIAEAVVDIVKKSFVSIQRKHINNVLQSNNFYSLGDIIDYTNLSNDARRNLENITSEIEKSFGEFERAYGELRTALLACDMDELIKVKNLRNLRRFIISLFLRSGSITRDLFDTIFLEKYCTEHGFVNEEHVAVLMSLIRMCLQAPSSGKYLLLSRFYDKVREWPICVFRTKSVPFCFSGSPVILHTVNIDGTFVDAGYFLAVSPDVAVYLFDDERVSYQPFFCYDVDGKIVDFLYLHRLELPGQSNCLYGQNEHFFRMPFWQDIYARRYDFLQLSHHLLTGVP